MDYGTLGSITTVVSFLTFIGIVAWAWSARRKRAFDAAALAPFALPDETFIDDNAQGRGRQ
jgi:cytochrome c oxidase cbb3-type subunit 4